MSVALTPLGSGPETPVNGNGNGNGMLRDSPWMARFGLYFLERFGVAILLLVGLAVGGWKFIGKMETDRQAERQQLMAMIDARDASTQATVKDMVTELRGVRETLVEIKVLLQQHVAQPATSRRRDR